MPEAVEQKTEADLSHITEGPNGELRVDPSKIPVKEQEAPKPAERPAWLPEKFKTAEEFAKSYSELEAKLSTPAPKTPDEAAKVVEKAGLDLPKLYAEFASNEGKLTDESLSALEKAGVSKETIDLHIKGLQALAQQQTADLASVVGGEAKMNEVLKWASTTIPKDQQEAYNAAIDSNNTAVAKGLLKGFLADYTAANGEDPELVRSESRNQDAGGVQGFASRNEMVEIMQTKKYKDGDPATHQLVKRRLAVTTAF